MPFAEGTDGGGSIRIPAAWCGVYGFKGSFGRVPVVSAAERLRGATPFVAEGPITRTVADAALALTALSGYDPRDPFSLDEQPDFTAATRRSIEGMRIAYSPDWDVFPIDPAVADSVAARSPPSRRPARTSRRWRSASSATTASWPTSGAG